MFNDPLSLFCLYYLQTMAQLGMTSEQAEPAQGFHLTGPNPELHTSREQRSMEYRTGEYVRDPRPWKAERDAQAEASKWGMNKKD